MPERAPAEYMCSECDDRVTPAEMGTHHGTHAAVTVTFTRIPSRRGVGG